MSSESITPITILLSIYYLINVLNLKKKYVACIYFDNVLQKKEK